ncbi:MAG: TRAP transporter permease, partial [Rhodospirillaceae bacterium]
AILGSAFFGSVSGSAVSNVASTGAITIPMMKEGGYSPKTAAAIEASASTGGQLMPPIMGAAAFLMVEYLGISLIEVMKHAILPALISYIALVYIVHLEACKLKMKGLPRPYAPKPWQQALASFLIITVGFSALCLFVYYAFGWMKGMLGGGTFYVAIAVILVAYVALVKVATTVPELDTKPEIKVLPESGPTVRAGLHFLLPVFVLVWCLMVERLSPGLSAFWATVLMMFIVITLRPLKALLRNSGDHIAQFKGGLIDLVDGLISGARNMIGIGVATAAAGVVVGTVTLMGLGQVMTEFVEFISGGQLMLVLLFTAIISLLLGMGLPTTANYIVVSSLMAPVIVTLGAENGLIVPLIAVHMFVFYFGILADDTPPVGLAAFAAAAISRGDPIRTGVQGFMYDIRTALLPFMFIFNTDLLLIDVHSVWHALFVFVFALIAMMAFACATQNFFIAKNKIWETALFLLAAFTLFRPGYWMDQVMPEFQEAPPSEMMTIVEAQPSGGSLTVNVEGMNIEGDEISKAVVLPLGAPGTGAERLESAGIILRDEDGRQIVDQIVFGSTAERLGVDFDFEITTVLVPNDRPPKEVFFIPAIGLLVLLYFMQRPRARLAEQKDAEASAA